jgi:1-acyl-sn-glycerol-3-phosphate acyltransferase
MLDTLGSTVRALRFLLHLLHGLLLALIYPHLPHLTKRRILQGWSAKLLRILNVRIELADNWRLQATHNMLIVSNHISWLDIFVLNAVIPMRFVAKAEVRAWPVLGWLCARAETLFIERGKARAAARINANMIELLQRGEILAVFPEGTTTDGSQLAHFHSSLIQPAIDAAGNIQPLALRYLDDQGAPSLLPAYVGEMSFATSLCNILGARRLHVRLTCLAPLDARLGDRRTLTALARQQIHSALFAAADVT